MTTVDIDVIARGVNDQESPNRPELLRVDLAGVGNVAPCYRFPNPSGTRPIIHIPLDVVFPTLIQFHSERDPCPIFLHIPVFIISVLYQLLICNSTFNQRVSYFNGSATIGYQSVERFILGLSQKAKAYEPSVLEFRFHVVVLGHWVSSRGGEPESSRMFRLAVPSNCLLTLVGDSAGRNKKQGRKRANYDVHGYLRLGNGVGVLEGVGMLVGGGDSVLVGDGIAGVAVTTTTTGSESFQATTSIATNVAMVRHSLFGTVLSASQVLGFVQFDGPSTSVMAKTSSKLGHPICVRISKTCFSTRTFRFPSHHRYRVSSPSFRCTSPVGVARNTL